MKNIFKTYITGIVCCAICSCADLDLNPLSEGSSDNWYHDETEIEMSLNNLLCPDFFPIDQINWDDDFLDRNGANEILNGTMTSLSSIASSRWSQEYTAISRALKILENLPQAKANGISEKKIKQYKGEAYFVIGFAYAELATYFGDCVLNKNGMDLNTAYQAVRSPKREVLNFAYDCLDSAATMLPDQYTAQQRPTKGAALAFKSRFALFHGDFEIAAKSAEECMNMNVYSLHDNYKELFTADKSAELIFYFKGDITQKIGYGLFGSIKNWVIRKIAGYANGGPSIQLAYAYTCTDGLPVDESPLFNPKDPFESRDPRMAYTIQPFKTKYSKDFEEYEQSKEDKTFPQKYPDYITLGYEYNPSPYATKVYQVSTGNMVINTDSKAANEHAAYNGFMLRKYVKDNWADYQTNGGISDNIFPYLRYAEVLLTYAEAMNELGKCDQEVLDKSINKVRSRAYNGTGIRYPRIMASSQQDLRKIIRMERRVEFPFEGMRYRDLLRWRIAEKTFNIPQYYLPRVWAGGTNWNGKTGDESNRQLSDGFIKLIQNWDNGNYPAGGVPQIDENGIPDVGYMEKAGYITTFYQMQFDAEKNYLWPIPAEDILVNPKLTQNDKY